jgi:hypothetical protein
MSDEVRKGRACSGIPKNAGGSIKREHVASFDVAKARIADWLIGVLRERTHSVQLQMYG